MEVKCKRWNLLRGATVFIALHEHAARRRNRSTWWRVDYKATFVESFKFTLADFDRYKVEHACAAHEVRSLWPP
eukprot:1736671-Alexandrium_andersonii.AAC.1